MKKKIYLILTAVLMCMFLFACSSAEDEPAEQSGISEQGEGDALAEDLLDSALGIGLLKYVDKSRLAMDCQTYQELAQALLVAEYEVNMDSLTKGSKYRITISENGTSVTKGGNEVGDEDALIVSLKEILGSGFRENLKKKTADIPDMVLDVDYSLNNINTMVSRTVDPETFDKD